jgi:hypothetical protein
LSGSKTALVGVTTQGDLVRAPAYPFHGVPPFQDMLAALVFLQRGFEPSASGLCIPPTFLAYVFTSYLSPSTRRFLGKDEKPALVYLNLSKNFQQYKDNKKIWIIQIFM